MNKIICITLILMFNSEVGYNQSIASQFIGSAGATIQGAAGTSLTFTVGEPIVDYYKCLYNFRIGFIQSMPVQVEIKKEIGFNTAAIKTTLGSNASTYSIKQDEKYILFDAVGRILQKGVNFRRDDPTIYFPMTGIYFVQSTVDDKTFRIEKIMISR